MLLTVVRSFFLNAPSSLARSTLLFIQNHRMVVRCALFGMLWALFGLFSVFGALLMLRGSLAEAHEPEQQP